MVPGAEVDLAKNLSTLHVIENSFRQRELVSVKIGLSVWRTVISTISEVCVVTMFILLPNHYSYGSIIGLGRFFYESQFLQFLALFPYKLPLFLSQFVWRTEDTFLTIKVDLHGCSTVTF